MLVVEEHGMGNEARRGAVAVQRGGVWGCAAKKAAAQLHERMVSQQTVCLRRLGQARAGEVRFGRLMNNERVTVAELVQGVCRDTPARCSARHVLAIQDTSELNYQGHARRVGELGRVGNGTDAGLFLHPVLAVDAQEGTCLGLAHVHLWQRLHTKAPDYRKLPIEDKESVRWITAAQDATQRLGSAQRVTVVADRESDIYEMWARLPDERTHLLIRASRDRAVQADVPGQTLFEWLSALPVAGGYELALAAVAGKRSAHTAVMHVRFSPVTLKRPRLCSDPAAPASVQLWAIEVLEDSASVVGQEKPIHWRLLTSHAVHTLEMARQCVHWYCQRWHIEQLFRTLKSQGLDVESSLLETGPRLEKLAVLAVSAATRIMQLTLARDGGGQSASDAFTVQEIELMHQLTPTLEGATARQKNPHPPNSLSWAAWSIARLGGWKGYASERKPGPITMSNGLKEFIAILRGWLLSRGEQDVCIQ